jgi:hypothetical protein
MEGEPRPTPVFLDVLYGRELQARSLEVRKGKGVMGGRFRPKTSKTRRGLGSAESKRLSVIFRILHE